MHGINTKDTDILHTWSPFLAEFCIAEMLLSSQEEMQKCCVPCRQMSACSRIFLLAVQVRQFDHTPLIILSRADTSLTVGHTLERDGLSEDISVTSHIFQVTNVHALPSRLAALHKSLQAVGLKLAWNACYNVATLHSRRNARVASKQFRLW